MLKAPVSKVPLPKASISKVPISKVLGIIILFALCSYSTTSYADDYVRGASARIGISVIIPPKHWNESSELIASEFVPASVTACIESLPMNVSNETSSFSGCLPETVYFRTDEDNAINMNERLVTIAAI